MKLILFSVISICIFIAILGAMIFCKKDKLQRVMFLVFALFCSFYFLIPAIADLYIGNVQKIVALNNIYGANALMIKITGAIEVIIYILGCIRNKKFKGSGFYEFY